MYSKPHLGLLVICCLEFSIPAVAQLDSSALRGKFGAPLHRETYRIPSGFDLIVDFGANGQACKLELPALMPSHEAVSNTSVMRARMYAFLWELVPPAMRGKELGQRMQAMGVISMLSVDYDYVVVNELRHGDQFGNDTITVTFKDNQCQDPSGR